MGSLFSKKSPWRLCRQCKIKNVKLFERECVVCEASAKQLEAPANGSDRPLFGEYLCMSCEILWTSRLCWPCRYQTCNKCKRIVYPHYWRDLTARELRIKAKDHQREVCQKCLEVGYYCGDFAKLYGKI